MWARTRLIETIFSIRSGTLRELTLLRKCLIALTVRIVIKNQESSRLRRHNPMKLRDSRLKFIQLAVLKDHQSSEFSRSILQTSNQGKKSADSSQIIKFKSCMKAKLIHRVVVYFWVRLTVQYHILSSKMTYLRGLKRQTIQLAVRLYWYPKQG